jgi:hypothetical protein
MNRYARASAVALVLTLAAAGPARAQSQIQTGTLDATDTKLDNGRFVEEFEIQPPAGQALVVTLVSLDFDPYLIVEPPTGDGIENDDLAGSKDVAQIVAEVEQSGPWKVHVTSYEADEIGDFALVWRSVPPNEATRVQRKQQEGTLNVAEMEPDGVMPAAASTHTFEGALAQGDKRLPSTEWFDLYVVDAAPGQTLTFALASEAFDPYLAVASPTGEVTENDDDGQTTNSLVEVQVAQDGRWYAIVTSAAPLLTGDYRLTVTRGS